MNTLALAEVSVDLPLEAPNCEHVQNPRAKIPPKMTFSPAINQPESAFNHPSIVTNTRQ